MWQYPAISKPVLYGSLIFPIYYFSLSFALQIQTTKSTKAGS